MKLLTIILFIFIFAACNSSTISKTDTVAVSDDDTAVITDETADNQTADEVADTAGDEEDAITDAQDNNNDDDTAVVDLPLTFQTDFIDIEQISYSLKRNTSWTKYTSDETRMWYSFQPADESPETKPLVVFFNGGPGSSTGLLMGFNTGNKSLDPVFNGGGVTGSNPYSWTAFANLLYIDARNTGFSYSVSSGQKGFTTRNFNCLFDGADFIRVILRFLASHKAIQANPVIINGESYGGTRVTVMLHMLLNYKKYADQSQSYVDTALVDEIQRHYDAAFPDLAGTDVPAATIAGQFGHQVMIEPLIFGNNQDVVAGTMLEQPDSPVYKVAAETGMTFRTCAQQGGSKCDKYNNALTFLDNAGRDVYKYNEAQNWLTDTVNSVIPNLLVINEYINLLGYDAKNVGLMYADKRVSAYKNTNPVLAYMEKAAPEPVDTFELSDVLKERVELLKRSNLYFNADDPEAEFREAFGTLNSFDSYYISLSDPVNSAFYSNTMNPYNTLFGNMFLENLLFVKTFITQAAYDVVIYAPAIPDSTAAVTAYVSKVEKLPDSFVVYYKQDAFPGVNENDTRTVAFPVYDKSGHSVTVTQPDKFLNDVLDWYKSE